MVFGNVGKCFREVRSKFNARFYDTAVEIFVARISKMKSTIKVNVVMNDSLLPHNLHANLYTLEITPKSNKTSAHYLNDTIRFDVSCKGPLSKARRKAFARNMESHCIV